MANFGTKLYDRPDRVATVEAIFAEYAVPPAHPENVRGRVAGWEISDG
jgi:hypothetical protein